MTDCTLYIVATPIGNLQDISLRALDVLRNVSVVACEDTRVTKKLFALLQIPLTKKFICYQNYNEQDKAQMIADLVKNGNDVALVSDAGSPLISDPGYKLISLCRKQGVKVCPIPGASAVICALQLSGLPTDRFMFAGFIPNKDKARSDLFNELKNVNTTLVFYETAPRLLKTLQAASAVFNSREIALVREISKLHEEARNGTADELISYFTQNPPKGEMVLVVAPPLRQDAITSDVDLMLSEKLKTMSLKSAVAEVAEQSGLSKKEIYALALELKNEKA